MPRISQRDKEHQILKGLKDSGLICLYSSRHDKNMSLHYGNTGNSLENRKNFLSALGINYQDLICLKQIHGNKVRFVQERDRGRGALSYDSSIPDTDALVTDKKNLPLAVFTADCLSVFLYDPTIPAIGLVHAGWRGSRDRILVKTAGLMQKKFNCHFKNIKIAFGPAIRSCCYQVGENFNDFFSLGLIKKNGSLYLDLIEINKNQLLALGIDRKNFNDCLICTSCKNQDFFSYRREKDASGRMISVMMLV